ncbi:MAG: hypothetical protein JSV86_00245 [Gemmatimonadota bacterium]|nr:MAG: hypothetical protein JSV86_00245 [Gemmatimonadota bacterium]
MANPDGQWEWEGQSGKKYVYLVDGIDQQFQDIPGNYIYAKEASPDGWTPIYIGETGEGFGKRFAGHEKGPCIEENGATHIHTHYNTSLEVRLAEESDLRDKWDPVCNKE